MRSDASDKIPIERDQLHNMIGQELNYLSPVFQTENSSFCKTGMTIVNRTTELSSGKRIPALNRLNFTQF